MLTKPISYFAISTTVNERNRIDAEYFDTIEDAWDKRYEYADWWCSYGRVTIKEYGVEDGRLVVLQEWAVDGDTWMIWKTGERGSGCPKIMKEGDIS